MSRFSDEQRHALSHLADILIPEAEGMPSASSIGISEAQLDMVANLRPDIVADLYRVLRASNGVDPHQFLVALRTEDADGFNALALVVAGGYYVHPKIRGLLGYSGPERRPVDPQSTPDFLVETLLAPVLAKGQMWRLPEKSK